MRQDLESRPLRVPASEQYQAALRAAQIEYLRLSERVHRQVVLDGHRMM